MARWLCIALLYLVPSACFAAAQPAVLRDLLYTSDSSGSYRADLYQPTGPGPHPAVVAIHGGSWRSGHKTEMRRLCTDLAQAGYACFAVDYDTHRHSFPLSWIESRAALDFLRQHAGEYSIDRDRIAVLGTSAGGQIAALLALAPGGPTLDSMQRADIPAAPAQHAEAEPIAAAVLFNGGYDLHPRHWLLRRYLGGNCEDIPDVCNDASPDFHVHPGAPPMYVGHGTHDHLIPFAQATTFTQLLQQAHDPVTPFFAEGAGHSYWRSHHWYARNLQAAEQFLDRVLNERGSPQ